LQAFNEVQPHIVHFSGHGCRKAELILEDNGGNARLDLLCIDPSPKV
jgi:hypothetical protein